MSEHDGHEDEMSQDELTDAEVELHLFGRGARDRDTGELGDFLSEIRETYAREPADQTARAHLEAIAKAAAERAHVRSQEPGPLAPRERIPKRRPIVGRKRLALLFAAVVLGVLLLLAALAAAGVNLPGGAGTLFNRFGVQPPDRASADSVETVPQSAPPVQNGRSFGPQVGGTATAGGDGPCQGACSIEVARSSGGDSYRNAPARLSFGGQTGSPGGASSTDGAVGEPTSEQSQDFSQGQSPSSPVDAQAGPSIGPAGPSTNQAQVPAGQQVGQGHSQGNQHAGPSPPAQSGQELATGPASAKAQSDAAPGPPSR